MNYDQEPEGVSEYMREFAVGFTLLGLCVIVVVVVLAAF